MDSEVACAVIIQRKLSFNRPLCSGHLGYESRVSGAGLQMQFLTHHLHRLASLVEQEERRPLLVMVSGNTKMAENKMGGVHAT